MNENTSSNSVTSAQQGLTAEAISRRAYEIWEHEGRPENQDLHHWLRAEQELRAERGQGNSSPSNGTTRSPNTDTPLQTTRGTSTATRESKSSGKRSNPPFSGDKARSAPPSIRSAGRS